MLFAYFTVDFALLLLFFDNVLSFCALSIRVQGVCGFRRYRDYCICDGDVYILINIALNPQNRKKKERRKK